MSPKTEQNNLLMLASLATSLYEEENNSVKKDPKMMSFRTFRKKDFTCELCGFEPKTKNKYREKQDHLMNRHFKKQIDQLLVNNNSQKKCPTCDYEAGDRQSLLRHYTAKHGILEKLLSEALEEKNIDDEMKVENNRGGAKRKFPNDDVISADEEEKTVPKKLALSTLSNNNFSPKVSLSTNSKIQPKPCTTTNNILPQNVNVPLVIHSATNVEIPRKILPAPPPTFKVPMVPSISKKARLSPKLKFQCQQCLKPFLNNRDLTRHAVVHTQEKNFKCSFCTAAFFGRKDHLVRHEQNCLNKNSCIQSASKLMSPGGSEVQSVIRIRPLNQLMPSSLPKSVEEPIEEFNHPISDDPYIPTILDPTYYPSVEEPEIHLITSEETNIVEEKSIDQQKIIENEVLELHSFPSTNNSQWSGTNRVHSVIPTIIDDVDGNYDQEEPLNFVIGENENEDLELVIDEDFSSDVQNDINDDDDERNICLHIPLKKRGKFSCNNCSLRKELKNVYTNMYSEKNI